MGRLFKNLSVLRDSLTGVNIDEKSKILRITFFSVFAVGILWAVWSYFRAVSIGDLYNNSYSGGNVIIPQNDGGITKLVDHVRAVISMRSGGKILAESISSMNRRLFNDDAKFLSDSESRQAGSNDLTIPGTSEQLQMTVRAIMIAGKERKAVIDLPNSKGLIIRQGSKIPALNARVTRVDRDGVTFTISGKKFFAAFGKTQTGENNSPSASSKNDDSTPTLSLQEALKIYQELHGSRP